MKTNLTEDEIIEEIIKSFDTFAFSDIDANVKSHPIAAFILCSCLIDQLATFIYNPPLPPKGRSKFHYEKFIEEYLNHYVPLDLYVNLRCNLVHNYTIGQYLSITSDTVVRADNTSIIHAYKMAKDLKDAFEKIKTELRDTDSQQRKNAIDRYRLSKIITGKTQHIKVYNNDNCKKLMEHYARALEPFTKQLRNIKKITIEQWTCDIKDNFFIIIKLITDEGEGTFLLDDIIQMANLEPADTVLERLNVV